MSVDVQRKSFLSINLDGFHKISYLDWGDPKSDKVMICVHGLSRNAHDFDDIAKALVTTQGYRVIAVDVVGRGCSDYLDNAAQYGFPLYLSDLMGLLAHIDRAKPACVDWLGCVPLSASCGS